MIAKANLLFSFSPVAIQCLEQAYNVNPVDGTLPSKKPLLDIFAAAVESTTVSCKSTSIYQTN